MFLLSRRFGALADRFGPRFFMGAGPLVAAVGLLLFQRVGLKAEYVGEVLPALLVFSLGLSMTVAPLTAAVLAGSEHEAGIASGVNNAVARVAGLLGTAAVGAAVATSFGSALDRRQDARRGGADGGSGGQEAAAGAPGCARPPGRAGARADARGRGGVAAQLPPRPRDRGRARGRGGHRRRARHSQPASPRGDPR
jgi:MFS family permease